MDCGGFLLGHAVEGAESPGEVEGINSHDTAVWVCCLENLHSDIIGGVAEGGDDESSVDEDVVAVAGGESVIVEKFWWREREGLWEEAESAAVAGGGDGIEVGAECGGFGCIVVPGCRHEHMPMAGEAGGLIDVTIRIITDDAMSGEPDHVFRLEPDGEDFVHDLAGHTGVAIWVEEAAVGGEDCAFTVAFDGATFEDESGSDGAEVKSLGDASGGEFIEIPRRVFSAPGIVVPVEDDFRSVGGRVAATGEEDGSVVAAPGIIDGDIEPFGGEACAAAAAGCIEQWLGGFADACSSGEDAEGFEFGDGGGKFCEGWRDAFKDSGPGIRVDGPCCPGGGV